MTNRFAKPLIASILIAVIAGCSVSPEKAQINRDARLAQQFPNPNDRKGMFVVWQSERGEFNVEYLANEISEATAVARIGPLCRKLDQGNDARLRERWTSLNRNVTLGDGSTTAVRAIKVACV